MAAFVLTLPVPPVAGQETARLDIFPGAATPAVFPAGTPFWIGYGFTVEPDDAGTEPSDLSPRSTFELIVDGAVVAVRDESRTVRGRAVERQVVATFEHGLPAGWHRFEGRWYDAGALRLTSDKAVEFVEA